MSYEQPIFIHTLNQVVMFKIGINTETLFIALAVLATDYEVIAIQFEDGSGLKYNIQTIKKPEWHFIELTEKQLIDRFNFINDAINKC